MKMNASAFSESFEQNKHHENEQFMLELLNSLNPSNTLDKQQVYRIQLAMSFNCTVICCVAVRLYMSFAKQNKWKNTQIEGALVLLIDKDMNYAPVLRIVDLNNFKVRFELELFHQFSSYMLLANPYFLVINLPKIVKNYFGFSFSKAEDAKIIHEVVQRLTNIEDLTEVMTLPSVQEMLLRRNQAFQQKDIDEKYGKPKQAPIKIEANADLRKSDNKPRTPDYQKIQQATVFTSFWGDDKKEQEERQFYEGGRVSNIRNQKDISHSPISTHRGDLSHGEPNMVMYDNKRKADAGQNQQTQQAINKIIGNYMKNEQPAPMPTQLKSSNQQKSYAPNIDQFGQVINIDGQPTNLSQSKFLNPSQNYPQFSPQQNPNQLPLSQSIQIPSVSTGGQIQRFDWADPNKLSMSSKGYDERSQRYDPQNVDPEMKIICEKAGIKPQELSSAQFAPMIKAIVEKAESSYQGTPGSAEPQMKNVSLVNRNETLMPQSSVIDQFSKQKAPVPTIQEKYVPSPFVKQIIFLTVRNIPNQPKEDLTLILARAIEERRRQMNKNVYDSDEKSSWANDDA